MSGPARPAYHLYRWLWGSLDLLYPPTCGGCDRRGAHWCNECWGQIKKIKPPICVICGQPWESPGLCQRCSYNRPNFLALRSWALYEGPVRQAILHLKYKRNISLGLVLAQPLIELFFDLGWRVDLMIPVPLGIARLRERGYNQATLFTRPLALRTGLPCEVKGLFRIRETQTQVGLSYDQRKENVKNAFQAHKDLVFNRRILVVDDVSTSNATLDSCGAALYDAGAERVYGLTLARAC